MAARRTCCGVPSAFRRWRRAWGLPEFGLLRERRVRPDDGHRPHPSFGRAFALHQPTWGRLLLCFGVCGFLGTPNRASRNDLGGIDERGVCRFGPCHGVLSSQTSRRQTHVVSKRCPRPRRAGVLFSAARNGVRHAEPEQPSDVLEGHRSDRGERSPRRSNRPRRRRDCVGRRP